jgi:hypothetical protein
MGKRKQPVTRAEMITAAGALIASSSAGMPVALQIAASVLGLALLSGAIVQ